MSVVVIIMVIASVVVVAVIERGSGGFRHGFGFRRLALGLDVGHLRFDARLGVYSQRIRRVGFDWRRRRRSVYDVSKVGAGKPQSHRDA